MSNSIQNSVNTISQTSADLANTIRRALFKNREFDCRNITIQVVGKKVFIEGTVVLQEQKVAIERFVIDLPEVDEVASYITCKGK